jgi:hypothetical protein
LGVVFCPEFADFLFKVKRVILYIKVGLRIGSEFGGHLASHYTRKYNEVATAAYNLFEFEMSNSELDF